MLHDNATLLRGIICLIMWHIYIVVSGNHNGQIPHWGGGEGSIAIQKVFMTRTRFDGMMADAQNRKVYYNSLSFTREMDYMKLILSLHSLIG